jgi:hypothetical protein
MKLGNSAPISSDNVLARMSPEMAATFSPIQVQALQAALTPRHHPVNIRPFRGGKLGFDFSP